MKKRNEYDKKRGTRLREARKNSGMTVLEIAEKCNRTRSAIVAYECGRNYPTPEVLQNMMENYNVTSDYIMKGEEPGKKPNIEKMKPFSKKEFGKRYKERFKEIKEIRSMTRDKLLEEMGIDVSSHHRYGKGEEMPHMERIIDIADELERTIDYLLYGIEEKE